jgi:hypothetical protein
MAECRSCKARIVWAVTEATGKRVPIDLVDRPDGNLVYTSPPEVDPPTVRYLRKDEEYDGTRFVSHFATCPHAAQHRRPTR